MQWFRLYDDVLDDPKVQQLRPELFKHWINLLCLANKNDPRGELPNLNAIAFRLRLSEAKAATVIRELMLAGLLDGDDVTLHPHNWDTRQRKSDNVAERVAKHRRNVTCNVTETADVTPPDTDTDTDTDTEIPATPEAPVPPAPVAPPAKPRTEKQRKADAVYERRLPIVEAFFRGLGIERDSLAWNQRFGPSLKVLTPAILDSPECAPEIVEPLTRYTASAYLWRQGKSTPSLAEVLTAFPEWDAAGRPEKPPGKVVSINGNGHRKLSVSEQNAMVRAKLLAEAEAAQHGGEVIDAYAEVRR